VEVHSTPYILIYRVVRSYLGEQGFQNLGNVCAIRKYRKAHHSRATPSRLLHRHGYAALVNRCVFGTCSSTPCPHHRSKRDGRQ